MYHYVGYVTFVAVSVCILQVSERLKRTSIDALFALLCASGSSDVTSRRIPCGYFMYHQV
jgi:hypothetical protein